jgi:drug/metabolite transporter (DMT)-like permease
MTVKDFTHDSRGGAAMTGSAAAPRADQFRIGLLFAATSAFAFGMSGPFAKALMEAGWSPTAAVTARLVGGAAILAVAATLIKPDWLRQAREHSRTVVVYGLIPVAGAQVCYYNAVARLSVAVALLLEYTAPILVVAWLWATTRQRPSGLTLAGVALAISGVTLVLDVFSSGTRIDPVGVAWALGAALCAGFYFMMSDRVTADGSGLHSITLATGGLVVAATVVTLLGITGVMPLTFTANHTTVAGASVPWLVPVILLAIFPTALAYILGISGVARLRPSFASLVGLTEVLAAVLAAWLLIGERISLVQAAGGVVVLLGLALARVGHRSAMATPDAAADDELAPVPPVPSAP